MQVGKHTYGKDNITVHSWDEDTELVIGNFCSIAPRVKVFIGGNHRTDWISTYPFGFKKFDKAPFDPTLGLGECGRSWVKDYRRSTTRGGVTVGSDVWIGSDVTIMSGVTVGDGAVLAANSHVVKDVAPYTICGGNPAKPIRRRFPDDVVEKLLKLRWWDKSDEEIGEIKSILCSSRIDLLFQRYGL